MGILTDKKNEAVNKIRRLKAMLRAEADALQTKVYWADETLVTEKFLVDAVNKIHVLNEEFAIMDSRQIKKEIKNAGTTT